MTELVVIGRIIKPHGIRGEVVVDSLSDVPGRFDPDVRVRVGQDWRTIASSRPHQGRLLVSFAEIPDRNAAEELRGREIFAEAVDRDEAETYWVDELVGMEVYLETEHDLAPLGTVVSWIELPESAGYDLLEIEPADGPRWLLPAVDDYVVVGEIADGTEALVIVDPPEGLLPGSEPETTTPEEIE